MRQFFSTILSQAYSRKKIILGGLAIALFFSLVPVQFAQANIFSDILGFISNIFLGWAFGIPLAIVTAVLYVLALLAAWLGVVILAVLKIFLVASVSFPLLPGHSIEVVNFGWEFSRNLVNIVFILILVFIGLATILRIQNYQLQKTLPLLVVMALLVNFSGVFVSFIVDIANVFTNAFVSQLGTLDMGIKASKELLESLVKGLVGVVTNITDIGAIIIPAVKGAVYLGFYLIFALIMFIVTLLMIVRVGILCALTILAPIAFASYILPATKNIWNQWLKQLIQWAIIGIPMTFFLLLAQKAATGAENIKEKFMVGFDLGKLGGADPGIVNIIMDLTGPFMALLLVAIGVMVSMQMAPAGASAVINWGKKAGLKAGGWAGREGWRKIGGKVEKWSGGMRTKGEEMNIMAGLQKEQAEKDGKLGFWTRGRLGLKGLSGAALRTAASGVETGSKRANEVVKKRDEETIAKAEKEVGENSERGFDIINVESMKKGVLEDTSKMLGAFTKIIKNGDTDDIYDRIKDGRMSWDFVRKMYKNAVDNNNVEQRRLIEKAFLSRTQDKKDAQGNVIARNELGVSQKHQDEIWDKLKAQDFDKIVGTENLFTKDEKTGELVVNQEIADRVLEKGEAGIPRQMIQRGKMVERRAFAKYLASKPVEWYQTRDREDIVTLSTTDAAAAVGMLPIGGLTRDEAKRLHREKIKGFRTDEELTTRQRILEDRLQQRNDKLTADLAVPNLQQKAKSAIQRAADKEMGGLRKEINELQNERNERSFKDDELYDQKQTWDSELKRVYTMPEDQRKAEDYRSIGQAQEQLLRINAELKRRGLSSEQKVVTGEQPLSVQIARLKEQEEQLKQIGGTRKEIRGVPIPGTGEAGVSYLPGEKARAELKKVQAQRAALEKKLNELPVDHQVIDASIAEDENNLRVAQQRLGTIQQNVEGLRQREKRIYDSIQTLRTNPGASQKEIDRLQDGLEGTQLQRGQYEKDITKLQEEITAGQERVRSERTAWQNLNQAPQPPKDAETILQGNIEKSRTAEQTAQQQLAKLITQKAAPNELARARETLQKARGGREGWEHILAATQRVAMVRGDITGEQERFRQNQEYLQEITKAIEDIDREKQKYAQEVAKELEAIETETKRLEQQRTALTTQSQQEEAQLAAAQQQAVSRILQENPQVVAAHPEVQEILDQNPAYQNIMQKHQTRIREAEQQLAQARQELEGLPEPMRRTPPPQILERIQASQQRIDNLQQEIQAAQTRSIKNISQRDPRITEATLRSSDVQQAMGADPKVAETLAKLRTAQQQLEDAERTLQSQRELLAAKESERDQTLRLQDEQKKAKESIKDLEEKVIEDIQERIKKLGETLTEEKSGEGTVKKGSTRKKK